MLKSIDPSNGKELATFPELDAAGIEAAIDRAYASRHAWRDAGLDHDPLTERTLAGEASPIDLGRDGLDGHAAATITTRHPNGVRLGRRSCGPPPDRSASHALNRIDRADQGKPGQR